MPVSVAFESHLESTPLGVTDDTTQNGDSVGQEGEGFGHSSCWDRTNSCQYRSFPDLEMQYTRAMLTCSATA